MRFSGHETFPIREGWLHKGLRLLVDRPELLAQDDAADWLGVGRNMGKSIRYWLEITGLSRPPAGQERRRTAEAEPTELGLLIAKEDPFFAEPGTWWALHLEVVGKPELATTWAWFFDHFARSRFTKAEVLEALRRYLELHALKRTPPSARTLDRDVNCLLSSYARPIPDDRTDPEEGTDCPLRELGLMRHLRSTGIYQLDFDRKDLPPELFTYAVARSFSDDAPDETTHLEVSVGQAAGRPGGPGRAFCLTVEGVFEQAMRCEATFPELLEIGGLAGERILRVRKRPPLDWLSAYYRSVSAEADYAA